MFCLGTVRRKVQPQQTQASEECNGRVFEVRATLHYLHIGLMRLIDTKVPLRLILLHGDMQRRSMECSVPSDLII